MNEEDLSGYVRPRPIRVAFLIKRSEDSIATLEQVFCESFGRWGGRYSLIVPWVDGNVQDEYREWLRAYDPDVIYSYVDLDQNQFLKLHRAYGPAYLLKHEFMEVRADARHLRPQLPVACVSSIVAALRSSQIHSQILRVIDYLPAQPRNKFLDINFGTLTESFNAWPLSRRFSDVIAPIYLASADAQKKIRNPEDGQYAENLSDLLAVVGKQRNVIGLSQLAASAAPRLDMRSNFDEAFYLVVGDSFDDYIEFWNSKNRLPIYIESAYTELLVSPHFLKAEGMLESVAKFIRDCNGIHRNQITPWVHLKSHSLPQEELAAFADEFKKIDKWNGYQVGAFSSKFFAPTQQALSTAMRMGISAPHHLEIRNQWSEFNVGGKSAKVPVVTPNVVSGFNPDLFLGEQVWALDADIERKENYSRYSNVRHRWMFPRRMAIHASFSTPYQPNTITPYRYPRSSREGYLTLLASAKERTVPISLPKDDEAFHYAIERGADIAPWSRKAAENYKYESAYSWVRPSDKGRYLKGALTLFNGLQNSGSVLLHSFWKKIFDDLGGAIGEARLESIIDSLKKRLKENEIKTDAQWERLARLVSVQAHQARMPMKTVSYAELKRRFQPYLDREKEVLSDKNPAEQQEWLQRADHDFDESLKWLCARSILQQGCEWRCRSCFHINWNSLDRLSPLLQCEVCETKISMPVNVPWSFRLNDFLREGLKEHGIGALVWAAISLERKARDSFYFLSPHELFREYPSSDRARPNHEIDLIGVIDGAVHICEVKSSDRDIDIDSLIQVARDLRPDGVILAVMDKSSPRLVSTFQALLKELINLDIKGELLTLDNFTYEDDAYLHYE